MSRLEYGSGISTLNGKRKKKSAASRNDLKRRKSSATTSELTPSANSEQDGYTVGDFLKRWNPSCIQPLHNEFVKLKNEKDTGTFTASLSSENASRNRYTDVLCLDQTRVTLGQGSGNSQLSDYINANFVDGFRRNKAYIATQGPLQNTCEDFWQMVWEQNVLVIVMTTRIVEKGHHKCFQYWPKQRGKALYWKRFSVVNTSTNAFDNYIETELLLRQNETGEEHSVVHLLFTTWPDHGVPSSATDFLSFLSNVQKKQAGQIARLNSSSQVHFDHPILVHCSAGIGRTGSFITVDICTHCIEATGRLDVMAVVRKLRSQRAFSIQTVDQYIFCHKALIEFCQMKGYGQDENAGSTDVTTKGATCEDHATEAK